MIHDVSIIDVVDGSVDPDRSVVIRGNRIAAVGPADSVVIPAGAAVVNGTGHYLMPGLWDMHTHLLWSNDENERSFVDMSAELGTWELWERYYSPTMDLLIANGVTGIREMWGNLEVARRVRDEAAAGVRLAPRIVVAGHIVDGPPKRWPGLVIVRTPLEARAAVDSLAAAGAEFIKVRYRVRPDAYHALMERAREVGIPVAGHVPFLVRAADASRAGQRSIEHLAGVVKGCSTAEGDLIELDGRILNAFAEGDEATVDALEVRLLGRMLATQDEQRCRGLLRRFAANETWQVPTLALVGTIPGGDNPKRKNAESLLRFIHPDWLPSWTPEGGSIGQKSDEGYTQRRRLAERRAEIAGMAAEEGVPILSGSDTPQEYIIPGFSLHDELELLVEAGLTPLQALQAATINPARFLSATDSLGTVEAGKLADLVLLTGDPLEDIRNTRRIEAVVVDGRVVNREELDWLLTAVEEAFR